MGLPTQSGDQEGIDTPPSVNCHLLLYTTQQKKKKLKNPPLRHLISRFATDGVKTCQNLRFATEPLRYLGVFQEEPEAWLKLFGKPKVCPQKIDYSNQYHDFKDI